ncbi:hypothetical protein BC833DRAFT_623863 [Globomyces pollinis-pini]|nr:hypothetical protein BC833DRAFT_623863 [Globomyces pollinis-pini]
MLATRRFSTLPEEETSETVQELISTFVENLQQDQITLDTIIQTCLTTAKKRQEVIQKLDAQLQDASITVDSEIVMENELKEELKQLQQTQNYEQLQSLEIQKGKEINQVKLELVELEMKYDRLTSELKQIQEMEEREANLEPGFNTLALALFQPLGVEFYDMDENTKKYQRCMARGKNRLVPLNLNPNMSNFHYSNLLWDVISN